MKRRTVTLVFLTVFMGWNILTYVLLAGRTPSKQPARDADLLQSIHDLELSVKSQIQERESLIQELKKLQEGLVENMPSQDEQVPKATLSMGEVIVTGVVTLKLVHGITQEFGMAFDGQDVRGQVTYLETQIKQQISHHQRLLTQLHQYKETLAANPKLSGPLGQRLMSVVGNARGDNVKPVDVQAQVIDKSIGIKAETVHRHHLPEDTEGDPNKVILPILVIACNRPSINVNLDQLIRIRPSVERFPIIVSQDCGHSQTADVIKSYGDQVTHIMHPDLSDIKLGTKEKKFQGYYKIARHYKWAMNQVFHHFNYSAVIIVEDDLNIAPDFFEYFAATFPILSSDPSLWCVSAWNDNGKADMISDDSKLLYRTDFFPGLGWMMKRSTWLELEPKWPATFWDDWMRHPDQRKDRSCIRPEISRTNTFGKIGVSKGQFYEKHLKFIKLNDNFVPFTQKDLSYLSKDKYDELFVNRVYSVPLLTASQVLGKHLPEEKVVRVQYTDKNNFRVQAKQLGIMEDLKSGVPRAGYRGIVSFMKQGRRVYFSPPSNWNGYDPTWN